MTDLLVDPDTFEVDRWDEVVFLRCPVCSRDNYGKTCAEWANVPTLAMLRAAAEAHIAERHAPRSVCQVCGEPVTAWEYESITPDWQVGRGLTVRPCGHDVAQLVVEVP